MQAFNIRVHKVYYRQIISKIYRPTFFDYIYDYFFFEIAGIIILTWLYQWISGNTSDSVHVLLLVAMNLIIVQLLRINKQ